MSDLKQKPIEYELEHKSPNLASTDVLDSARAGALAEQRMSFRDALRLWRKAAIWSLLISTAIIMEAYDTNLLGNFLAYPAFKKKFGTFNPKLNTYNIPAKWQTALNTGGTTGQIIGLALNGFAVERFGYRRTMMFFMFLMAAFIFFPFFAPSLPVLLVGQILEGIPWGVFQTCTTAYASEVCPIALRPYLTTWVNSCWAIGKLLAAALLRGMISNKTEWGYRIPYALQWIWPFPIALVCYFAPESPWWLVRHGRVEEARHVILTKMTTPYDDIDFDVDNHLEMICHTNALEESISAGTTYVDCFRGVDRRRTLVSMAVWASQNLCGAVLGSSATFFLTSAGMPTVGAYSFNLGIQGLGLCGTFISWALMPHFDRRTLWIGGLLTLEVLLLIVGGLGFAPGGYKSDVSWGVGACLIGIVFVFDVTVGPICYALVSEMSSTRQRSKTIAVARITYNTIGIVNGIVNPYQLNPAAWNWGARTGFYWAGINGCMIVLHYFFLPETKGRTFAELDVLFERGTPARDFRKTKVDQFEGEATHDAVPVVAV